MPVGLSVMVTIRAHASSACFVRETNELHQDPQESRHSKQVESRHSKNHSFSFGFGFVSVLSF